MFEGANELISVGGQVEHWPHHPGRGTEQEQARKLALLAGGDEANLESGGYLWKERV